MINTVTVGWVLIVLGIIATMAGIAGAIIQLLRTIQKRSGGPR